MIGKDRQLSGVIAVLALGVLVGIVVAAADDLRNRPEHVAIAIGVCFVLGICFAFARQIRDLRDRAEHGLRQQTENYEALLRARSDVGEIVIVTEGSDRKTVYFNDAFASATGYRRDELADIPSVWDLVPEDLRAGVHARLASDAPSSTFETALLSKDGRRVDVEVSLSRPAPLSAGRVVAIARDVSQRKTAERELQRLALEDALTGLPNRNLFQDRLENAIASARRNFLSMSLLVLDLDDFKEVNDTFGHQMGDRLLQQVGQRLRQQLRDIDGAARLGGDEFAVVLPATKRSDAITVARRLSDALSRPLEIDGQRLTVGASIGIAVYPEHGQDAGTLLRRADIAMYSAKRVGSSHVVYSGGEDAEAASRLALIADFRYALERGELRLHYQAMRNSHSGEIVGVEALLRWQHPQRGLIAPAELMGIPEKAGLMTAVNEWTLDSVLRQIREWHRVGIELPIGMNISLTSIRDAELPWTIGRLASRHEVQADRLRLEITESEITGKPEQIGAGLGNLGQMGIRLARAARAAGL